MSNRTASCSCGQLRLSLDGDPVRVSVCHCHACQRRTGSVFGTQARFTKAQLVLVEGTERTWTRVADSGNAVDFHFCPDCGSTVWWDQGGMPGFVMVAVGAIDDDTFPAPGVEVYGVRRRPWCQVTGELVRHD